MAAPVGPVSGGWRRWVPGVDVIRSYQGAWLRSDLSAGLVLTALLVPQGMAYAELAGLPPVTGLYTTAIGLFAYALFGPSRILVLGPDSSLAPIIAAVVLPLVIGDSPQEAVAYAAVLALMTGVISVAAGLLRLGAITDLLSMPVRIGYLNGIAVIVLISQLPKLFGFSVEAEGAVDAFRAFLDGLASGLTNWAALLTGLVGLAVMIVSRRWFPRFPGVLVAVVGAIVVVTVLGLADEMPVVGSLPSGFPAPSLPRVALDDLGPLLAGAFAIALVSFADTASLSRSFSARIGQRVDPNQEVAALGVANLSVGFFQGFPISASSSRTSVADLVGSKTQLTGVIGGVAIIVLLVFVNDLFANLPSSILAAVVIVASFALFDLKTVRWLARVRRSDFALSAVAMLAVVVIGILEGLAIAVVLSIAVFVWRTWRPYSATLGRVEGRKGYHDVERHPDAARVPGLVLFRFDAPLFFANASYFEDQVELAIEDEPTPTRRFVVAAEPMTDVDSTGAEALTRVLDTLDRKGIEFGFAELKGPTKDRLGKYGLYNRIGSDRFYPTIGAAVSDYVRQTGVEWKG